MQPNEFCRFLTSAVLVPVGIVYIFILVDGWRQPMRRMYRIVAAYLVFHILLCVSVYKLTNPAAAARILGTVPILICWALYALLTKYRDGRFLFTVVSVALLMTIIDTLACVAFPYGSPYFLAAKLAVSAAAGAVLRLFCRRPFLQLLHSADQGWVRMTLIPLTFVMCLATAYDLPETIGLGAPNLLTALLLCASTPLVYAALYYFSQTLHAQYQAREDALMLRAQVQALGQRFEQLRVSDRKIHIFRHDLRHYVQLLKASVEAGERGEVEKLLGRMETELGDLSTEGVLHAYTGNSLMDTVLSLYAEQARENGAAFEVRLCMPGGLRADMTELAVVLSNALENALRACSTMPPGAARKLRVYDTPGAPGFFLTVANTFSEAPRFDRKTGLPEATRPGHGYGTQSMAAFAKKYGAALQFDIIDGMFCVSLLF